MDIREEEVEKFLDEHNDFTKSYFERKATSSMVDHWLANRSHRPGSRAMQVNHVRNDGKPERKSLGPSVLPSEKLKSLLSDDIDAMKSHSSRRKSELEVLDEKELFMELIRDIANELDINRLSHKILVNVSILTNADRCSLFLVQGSRDHKVLVSKLFDVTADSTVQESMCSDGDEIVVPLGVGIAGHTAQTGETVNIKNAYAVWFSFWSVCACVYVLDFNVAELRPCHVSYFMFSASPVTKKNHILLHAWENSGRRFSQEWNCVRHFDTNPLSWLLRSAVKKYLANSDIVSRCSQQFKLLPFYLVYPTNCMETEIFLFFFSES